jgi:hypothetical protein
MGFLEALLFSLEIAHGTSHAIHDNPNFKKVCQDRIGIFGHPLKNPDGTIKQKCRMVKKSIADNPEKSDSPDPKYQKN